MLGFGMSLGQLVPRGHHITPSVGEVDGFGARGRKRDRRFHLTGGFLDDDVPD